MEQITLSYALSLFYDGMAGVRAPKTITFYQRRLVSLERYFGGNRPIGSIKAVDLIHWRTYLARKTTRWEGHPTKPPVPGPLSACTLHQYVRSAKAFFNWLQKYEVIEKNPARLVELPELPKVRPRGIPECSKNTMLEFLQKTDVRDFAIVLFFADTGCRLSGIAGVTLDQVDISACSAMVHEKGKGGGKDRVVFFTKFTRDVIASWILIRPVCETRHLFVSRPYSHKSRGMQPDAYYRILERLAKKLGIEKGWNPHNWRHSAIRYWLEHGVTLPEASQLAGHSSVKITGDIYGIVPDSHLRKAHNKASWVNTFASD